MQHRSDAQLEAALDRAQYDQQDLITIRIPLNMPYQPEHTNFERVDGEITLQGTIYKYVMRKIDQGELVLLCLPNRRKMQLESGKDQFFQLASEFQQFTPKSHAPARNAAIFKISVFDVWAIALGMRAPVSVHLPHFLIDPTFPSTPFIPTMGQPPDLL